MRPQGSKEINSKCGSFYRITDPIAASQWCEIKMAEGVFKNKRELKKKKRLKENEETLQPNVMYGSFFNKLTIKGTLLRQLGDLLMDQAQDNIKDLFLILLGAIALYGYVETVSICVRAAYRNDLLSWVCFEIHRSRTKSKGNF